MKTHLLLLTLILSNLLNLHGQTKSTTSYDYDTYYSNALNETGDDLKSALHDIIKGYTALSYSEVWDALQSTDEDPDNSDNVILLYTGWSIPKEANASGTNLDTEWNREHTWAKTYGDFGTSTGPGTDIHHLRPSDVTVNSARGSLMFDDADEDSGIEYVDDSYYYDDEADYATGCYYDSDSWEPRDEVKGDVARMLFYMAVRYEGDEDDDYGYDLELAEYCSSSDGLHGKLSTLLEWHEQDPVDEWEETRNEAIYEIQGNRNPFIDNEDWVEDIDWSSYTEDDEDEEVDTSDYIFYEDFEDSESLDLMTECSVTGDNEYWYYSTYSSNSFAKMSGYNSDESSTYDNEDWLISANAIDLSNYSNIALSFITIKNTYSSLETSLYLKVSTDYDGSSDPSNYTWTDLTDKALWSTGGWDEVESGDIDLSDYAAQSIYIAFTYISTTTDGSDTWEIDDIAIKDAATTAIDDAISIEDINLYPNPANTYFEISNTSSVEVNKVFIYSQAGRITKIFEELEDSYEINGLERGLYFVKIQLTDGSHIVKKLMIE